MLGDKIKAERLRKGLSQQAFADRLAVVRQTVSKWEKGLSVPDSDMLLKIAEALDTTPSNLLDKEKAEPTTETDENKKSNIVPIVLIILGFPIWFSLAVAAISVIISLYVSIWSVIISLWAVFASLVACGFGFLVSGGIFAYYAHPVTGFAVIGAGLILAGVSIFLFFGCQYLTSGTVTLTKKCAVWLKSFFLKRRGAKS